MGPAGCRDTTGQWRAQGILNLPSLAHMMIEAGMEGKEWAKQVANGPPFAGPLAEPGVFSSQNYSPRTWLNRATRKDALDQVDMSWIDGPCPFD